MIRYDVFDGSVWELNELANVGWRVVPGTVVLCPDNGPSLRCLVVWEEVKTNV